MMKVSRIHQGVNAVGIAYGAGPAKAVSPAEERAAHQLNRKERTRPAEAVRSSR